MGEAKPLASDAITKLKIKLELLEESTKNRVVEVYSSIEALSKELISSDGGYENSFNDPDKITFDFARNKMSVNGRSKFSASSMVIMKNSIRVAIFIHTVSDKMARLPRFILMDKYGGQRYDTRKKSKFSTCFSKQVW